MRCTVRIVRAQLQLLLSYYDFFNADGSDEVDSYLQRMSNIHAGTFVNYLIDTYGMDKFADLYNQDPYNGSFESVYQKDLKTLEEKWLENLVPNKEALADKFGPISDIFIEDKAIIAQIDPSIFEEDEE